ncbi:MFS general substrate transporter [Fomitopsis serialis]|uniref:MFS general substrate transporter n=1 Tax=Fomitopsis serialis TaxID=139415 RepID=UPI002008E29D|nr:MFS general substrate transporter [Neoantrodia serialis]KAH9921424.1 MFS general substrate transporter [Neoantrodia serialis]
MREVVSAVQDADAVEMCKLSKVSDTEVEVTAVTPLETEEPIVTRKELWSYYLYCNADMGVGPMNWSMTLFQSLATSAGWDPSQGPGSTCTTSGPCVVPWGSGTKSVSSVVLIANGLSFAIMSISFTTFGSAADYGNLGRWFLLGITVIGWVAQFASMALTKPSRWGAAMAIFIISYVSYGASLVLISAIFPRLARNTPHARYLREKLKNQEISIEEYEVEESLEKNRISNISSWHSNIGFLFALILDLATLLPLANNPLVDQYTIVITNMYWVVLGVWWFIYQQPRPGPPLPSGEHYLTIGWKQIWVVLKQWKKLPFTFVYLFAFFLLSDGLNTTGTLISICQNDLFEFSFLQNTYLGIAQAFTGVVSTIGFWWIQKYWKISTKKMFVVTNVVTVLIPIWGMIGLWTTRFGFHQVWEYWAFNVIFGLFQAPYYAYSQTMMAELAPPGFDNMFFALFGLSNRVSSIIGPNVIQAIINETQNNWEGFPFLVALCTVASLAIWFGVDVEKGRRDAAAWAEQNRSYAKTGMYAKEDASESLDSTDSEGKA